MAERPCALEDMELKAHRFLVTGGYGLIGSWLVHALLGAGARVCVVRRDRPVRSALVTLELESRVDVVDGDICSPGVVARAIAEYEVESVFHLAAQTIVGTARRVPLSTYETNVGGTWTVLEACRQQGVQRVVVASSDKAYGSHTRLPYREDAPLQPHYPYDVSKAAADLLARSYWHTWRLPVAVTRLANVYGGGDPNESRLVPETVTAALRGVTPVIRSDGAPERDYLFVADAVAAYLALWNALGEADPDAEEDAGVAGEAFNAGGGRPYTVLEVAEIICRLAGTGVLPDVRRSGTPPGEIERQWVDSAKLRALTGWEAKVGLEEGLRRTVQWYEEHPEWLDSGSFGGAGQEVRIVEQSPAELRPLG